MRHFDEGYLDRVRSYRRTHPYRKALRKRKVWVEPLFAEAKDRRGMRRFRLRGLDKVNAEALLIAAGQNLKRLLTSEGRPPKRAAQAAALRPPTGLTSVGLPTNPRPCRHRNVPVSRAFATAWPVF